MTRLLLIATFLACPLFLGSLLSRWLYISLRTKGRWDRLADDQTKPSLDTTSPRGWLSNWLYLAGYRSPLATIGFVTGTLLCSLFGIGSAILFTTSGLQESMERSIVLVPGGVGETFLPIVWVAPWILATLVISLPLTIVRASRRKRVELIEQDLPLAMELMATLSEAGLSFDAALQRILKTRLAGRPLASELTSYQTDLLAGRPRVESLRRLSERIRVSSVSILVSALVQAEQLGMGISRVLRQQADDIRARRRERAVAFANALPVKRLFPLVICFLPGLFVWTLGPAFIELFKLTETFTLGGGL